MHFASCLVSGRSPAGRTDEHPRPGRDAPRAVLTDRDFGADLFGVAARLQLGTRLPELPLHSREAIEQELATLDFLETQIESAEQRLEMI